MITSRSAAAAGSRWARNVRPMRLLSMFVIAHQSANSGIGTSTRAFATSS